MRAWFSVLILLLLTTSAGECVLAQSTNAPQIQTFLSLANQSSASVSRIITRPNARTMEANLKILRRLLQSANVQGNKTLSGSQILPQSVLESLLTSSGTQPFNSLSPADQQTVLNAQLNNINEGASIVELASASAGVYEATTEGVAIVKPNETPTINKYLNYAPTVLALGGLIVSLSSRKPQRTTEILTTLATSIIPSASENNTQAINKSLGRVGDAIQSVAIQAFLLEQIKTASASLSALETASHTTIADAAAAGNNPTKLQAASAEFITLLRNTDNYYSVQLPAAKTAIEQKKSMFNQDGQDKLNKIETQIDLAASAWQNVKKVYPNWENSANQFIQSVQAAQPAQ